MPWERSWPVRRRCRPGKCPSGGREPGSASSPAGPCRRRARLLRRKAPEGPRAKPRSRFSNVYSWTREMLSMPSSLRSVFGADEKPPKKGSHQKNGENDHECERAQEGHDVWRVSGSSGYRRVKKIIDREAEQKSEKKNYGFLVNTRGIRSSPSEERPKLWPPARRWENRGGIQQI